MILCGFQRPIGQRCVATPKNWKSSGLDCDRLQMQRGLISTPHWGWRMQRQFWVDSRGQPARRCVCDQVSDQVSQSPLERIHTRTGKLSIARSVRSDKLPSNWDNWQWQGRFRIIYLHKSRIADNAEAGHSPEAVYKLRAIHVDPHRRRQLKSGSRTTRRDGLIYVTEAAKSVNGHLPRMMCTCGGSGRIYAIPTIHT